VGNIVLSCSTTPIGNTCNNPPAAGSWHVINDGGTGNLSGWAWNDNIGWISFDCHNEVPGSPAPAGYCATSTHQVFIEADGSFKGWAWNDLVGWISFNCENPGLGGCGTSDYKVKTNWSPGADYGELYSSIYDTGQESGVAYNTIVWDGIQPAGTAVKFQFASADSPVGPWVFLGPGGTSQSSDVYTAGPLQSMQITTANHYNDRYFRYYMRLESNEAKTLSPIVQEVTISWSI
jgi:hypothetical protein